jgi:hypothetical protein
MVGAMKMHRVRQREFTTAPAEVGRAASRTFAIPTISRLQLERFSWYSLRTNCAKMKVLTQSYRMRKKKVPSMCLRNTKDA